jgi:WD40 repeat protein
VPIDFDKATLAWNLPWDTDWVTAVTFVGPRTLVAGNNRGEILAWTLPEKPGDPAPLPTLRLDGHSNVISRVGGLRDGRTVISSSYDHTLRVWDMQATPGKEETVALNAVLRDDLKKRSASKIPALVEAKVKLIGSLKTLDAHKEWVSGFAFSADESLMLSGDDGGKVILWDRPGTKPVREWAIKGWAYAVALSPDGKQAAVAERLPLVFDSGRHEGLKLWDATTGTMQHDLAAAIKGMYIAAAAYSPDGKLLAVVRGGEAGGNSGKATFFDPATGKKLHETATGHLDGATDVLFHPDGKHLLTTGRDTTVKVWTVSDGKLVKEIGKPRGGQFKDWICAVALSPDGQWLAAADQAGAVQVWTLG